MHKKLGPSDLKLEDVTNPLLQKQIKNLKRQL